MFSGAGCVNKYLGQWGDLEKKKQDNHTHNTK
jgi:hypothetical protein